MILAGHLRKEPKVMRCAVTNKKKKKTLTDGSLLAWQKRVRQLQMTLFHTGFNFQVNLSKTGICLSIRPNLSLCLPLDTSTKIKFSKPKKALGNRNPKTQKFVLGLKLRQIDIANQNQVFERRQNSNVLNQE